MESRLPENLATDLRKAVELLIRGRQFANQLGYMLTESPVPPLKATDGSMLAAKDFAEKILSSFTDTLSLLSSTKLDDICCQGVANKEMISSTHCRKSNDSTLTKSTSCKTKDRRGCYKRRKASQTWTRFSPTLIDDGYAWRKYGQKLILNAKHPRNYYRCTHKYDQGCQASKHVQRTEDEAAVGMFRTTYHGHHTCKNLVKSPPQIILDSTSGDDSSILVSFQSNNHHHYHHPLLINNNNNNKNKLNHPPSTTATATATSSFPSPPWIKQEYTKHYPQSLDIKPSDYFLPPYDLMTFDDGSGPMTPLSVSTDHGDVISSGVYSCTASTHDLEMDMIMRSVDFDDVEDFQF